MPTARGFPFSCRSLVFSQRSRKLREPRVALFHEKLAAERKMLRQVLTVFSMHSRLCVPLSRFCTLLTVLVDSASQAKQLTNGNLLRDSNENLVSVSTCIVRLAKGSVKNRKVGYSADNPAGFRLTLISSKSVNRSWCVRALHLVEGEIWRTCIGLLDGNAG